MNHKQQESLFINKIKGWSARQITHDYDYYKRCRWASENLRRCCALAAVMAATEIKPIRRRDTTARRGRLNWETLRPRRADANTTTALACRQPRSSSSMTFPLQVTLS